MPRQTSIMRALPVSLLILTLATPTDAGTRAILRGAEALKVEKRAAPRALKDVLANTETGLDLETAKDRDKALNQARAYSRYRLSRKPLDKSSFAEACLKEARSSTESRNPFCVYEALRLATREARPRTSSTPSTSRNERREIINELKTGRLENLRMRPYRSLVRAVSHFDDYKDLQAVAKRVITSASCDDAVVATVLAGKAEEFFPEASMLETGLKLYRLGADCAGTEANIQARFRFSLLSVWQNKCADADAHLAALQVNPGASEYHSRAAYWRHHCAQTTGNTEVSEQSRETLWKSHMMSFHNIVVNGADERMTAFLHDEPAIQVRYRSALDPELNALARAMEALLKTNQSDIAAEMADEILPRLATVEPEFRLYIGLLMNRSRNGLQTFKVLSRLFSDAPQMVTTSTLRLFFPLWYYDVIRTAKHGLDPLLVTSLIRQESAFNPRARSGVGARGLMQVMPATARYIARVPASKLFDIPTNVQVGTKYFGHRLEKYNGDAELTLAAYNAGFTRVDRWIVRYPVDNRILFMDLIPFRETRGYVSSILRNYFWYMKLYEKEMLEVSLEESRRRQDVDVKALSFLTEPPAGGAPEPLTAE